MSHLSDHCSPSPAHPHSSANKLLNPLPSISCVRWYFCSQTFIPLKGLYISIAFAYVSCFFQWCVKDVIHATYVQKPQEPLNILAFLSFPFCHNNIKLLLQCVCSQGEEVTHGAKPPWPTDTIMGERETIFVCHWKSGWLVTKVKPSKKWLVPPNICCNWHLFSPTITVLTQAQHHFLLNVWDVSW